MNTVDQIAALHPEIVIPGHQIVGAPNDASVLAFMKKYMQDSDAAQASSKTADESKIENEGPVSESGNRRTLEYQCRSRLPCEVCERRSRGITEITPREPNRPPRASN